MSEIDLGALLADALQGGAYFVDARDSAAIIEAGNALGFAVAPVDCSGVRDKAAALEAFARALRFPDWFGDNWDALADSLGDLSWWPADGYLLLLEHVDAWRTDDPESFDMVLDILNAAAADWAQARVPFWALMPVSAQVLAQVEG
jgi:hypothetical protein